MKIVHIAVLTLTVTCSFSAAWLRAEEPTKDQPKKEKLAEEPPDETRRNLLSKKVSCNFVNTRLCDAIELIKAMTKLDIKIDPKLESRNTPITLLLKEMDVGTALGWIVRQAGTSYEIKDQSFIVPAETTTEPAKPDAATVAANDAIRAKLNSTPISLEFVDLPLTDAVNYVRALTDVDFVIDSSIKDAPQINLRVTKMNSGLALEWILKLSELEYSIVDKAVYIRKPKTP